MRDDQLIAKYIDDLRGVAEARLRKGVAVWAIVAYGKATNWDRSRVAYEFNLTEEEVDAALAYYKAQHEVIDARLGMFAA